MTRARFEELAQARWTRLAKLTAQAKSAGRGHALSELPDLYRQTCADLALAQHRGHGTRLCQQLNALVLDAHHVLYGSTHRYGLRRLVEFAAYTFPTTVRAQARVVWLAHAFFYLPFAAVIATTQFVPETAYVLVDAERLLAFETMHEQSQYVGGAGGGFAGFAGYLWHNGSIGLHTFAGGLLGSVGTLIALTYNGLVLGAVFGHLNRVGRHAVNAFAIGHGAFELTGIVLAGAAGLRLGLALFRPGRHSRADALRAAAQPAGTLVGGAVLMIGVAACIEATWSPSLASDTTKFMVGTCLWALVAAYLLLGGRRRRAA